MNPKDIVTNPFNELGMRDGTIVINIKRVENGAKVLLGDPEVSHLLRRFGRRLLV